MADRFVDDAYATVKGYVRTYVMHQQLLKHLPPPPATVLDLGGGAGNQSFPLAEAGYNVTLLDSSRPMLERARQQLQRLRAGTVLGLGVRGRADTVEELTELMRSQRVEPLRWYGVWLFIDWLELSGTELDPTDTDQVAAAAAVELEASRRDPYRQLSRAFHLVGRKAPS